MLYGVLKHSGAELSARQMIKVELERWSSIARVAAEYETIGAVAQRDRWVELVRGERPREAQLEQVLAWDSFGPLAAELRRTEAYRHDIENLLPVLVGRRSLDDAEDVGAVLSRLQRSYLPVTPSGAALGLGGTSGQIHQPLEATRDSRL